MNTLAETPVASHASAHSVHQSPAAAVVVAEIRKIVEPNLRRRKWHRVKELLVMMYAYGMLAFGVFFPLLLAAWAVVFWPDIR